MEDLELKEKIFEEYLQSDNTFACLCVSARKLDISCGEFIRYLTEYMSEKSKSKITILFDRLVSIEDEEKIIELLKESGLTPNMLNDRVVAYYSNTHPDVMLFNGKPENRLFNKIKIYERYLNSLKSKEKVDEELINLGYYYVNDFLNSRYSYERYCYQVNIGKDAFKNLLNATKKRFPELYALYNTKMDAEKADRDIQLTQIVNDYMERIKNGGLTYNEFLENTTYGIYEIVKYADSILNNEDAYLFRTVVSPFKIFKRVKGEDIDKLLNFNISYNVNGEIVTIDREIKEYAINYLQERDIPITIEGFRDIVVKKYSDQKIKHL